MGRGALRYGGLAMRGFGGGRVAAASFPRRATLRDGTPVELRFVRPEDKDELARRFAGLSAESRRNRFHAPVVALSPAMLRYLTEVDGRDHVCVVATTDSLDLKEERGLGVARFVRLAGEPEVAEAAVTVADEAQGQGLGTLLLAALAELARARGLRAFRGHVLASNGPALELFERLGAKRVGEASPPGEEPVVTLEVPLGEEENTEREPVLRRLFGALARLGAPAAQRQG